jgi:hypothetical protein
LSAKANALVPLNEKKGTVHLKHVVHLTKYLAAGSGPKEEAVFDLAIVAFWGMARLGKLTSPLARDKLDPCTLVFTTGVCCEWKERKATAFLMLRDAKTGKPGKTQLIKPRHLDNLLCLIEAVKRRLAVCKKFVLLILFNHVGQDGEAIHLTKDTVVKTSGAVWEKGGFQKLTGHLLRVGGASLHFAMGVKTREICRLGCWTSNCYKLYI